MRLARLTHLEVFKLEQELKELRERIKRLTQILGSKKLQMDVVKEEMLEIKRKFKTPRKSVILSDEKKYEVVGGTPGLHQPESQRDREGRQALRRDARGDAG